MLESIGEKCGMKCKILIILLIIGVVGAIIYYISIPKRIEIHKAELPPGTKLVYSGVFNKGLQGEYNYTEVVSIESPTKVKRVIYPVNANFTYNMTRIEYLDKEGRLIKYETPPSRIPKIETVYTENPEYVLVKFLVEYTPPNEEYDFPLFYGKSYTYSGIAKAKNIHLDENREDIIEEDIVNGKFNCTRVFKRKIQDRNVTCIEIRFHTEYAIRKNREMRPHPKPGKIWNGTIVENDYTGKENATQKGMITDGYYIYCDGVGLVEYHTHNEIHKEWEFDRYYVNDMRANLTAIERGAK